MTCITCLKATESPLWAQYDSPKCQWCAARLIKAIGTLKTPTSAEIAARRRVVLTDAIAWGHSELVIRRLYKDGPWLEPVEVVAKKVKG